MVVVVVVVVVVVIVVVVVAVVVFVAVLDVFVFIPGGETMVCYLPSHLFGVDSLNQDNRRKTTLKKPI